MRNYYCYEGSDGSGKTTMAKNLANSLVNEGIPVILTTEPSRGEIGMFIREKIFPKGGTPLEYDDLSLLLLFLADRVEHGKKLEKARARFPEAVIISDRYDLSTNVYQYLLTGDTRLRGMIKAFADNVKIPCPYAYFILQASPEFLLARIQSRQETLTKWEKPERLRSISHYYTYLKHYAAETKAFVNSEQWVLHYLDVESMGVDAAEAFTLGEVLANYRREGPVDPSPRVWSLEESLAR
jgi:dTMP kinase